MTIQELTTQLSNLTPTEKVEIIAILSKSLNQKWRGITKHPKVWNNAACLEGTQIPVWVLIGASRSGISESELLAKYSILCARDLVNAWTYAQVHSEEIDFAIQENQESYDCLLETAELLSIPGLQESLKDSMEQVERGETYELNQVFGDLRTAQRAIPRLIKMLTYSALYPGIIMILLLISKF